jgi:lipopolysaccharide export LptBFGC system permease protein LptF
MKTLFNLTSLAGFAVLAADPAWAGVAAPAPVLAAGAPVLAVFGAGYYLVRRHRRG